MKNPARVWTRLAGSAGAAVLAAACGGEVPPRNVLLISVDTLRRDYVGLYGASPSPTPEIDAFFAAGSVYENALSPSPCTLPAVAQVLTGTLEPRDRPRLAEYLSNSGYATQAIVSQHFFRSRAGPNVRFQRGFNGFDVQDLHERNRYGMTARRASTVSDLAIDWLRRQPRGDSAPPFHLWLHYFDPHDPYDAPSEFRPAALQNVSGDRRLVQCGGEEGELGCERRVVAEGVELFSEERRQQLRNLYAAEIRYTDHEIGRVLREVEELDLLPDTWTVLWSDHGEQLGEDGRWDHCQSVHGRELRVPLLVRRGMGRLAGKARHAGAVSTLDIVPTLLHELVPGTGAGDLDGMNLALADADRSVAAVWREQRTVLSGRWKLDTRGGVSRLIDLQNDVGEEHDVSGKYPERAAALTERIRQTDERDARLERNSNAITEELRAIGYIR